RRSILHTILINGPGQFLACSEQTKPLPSLARCVALIADAVSVHVALPEVACPLGIYFVYPTGPDPGRRGGQETAFAVSLPPPKLIRLPRDCQMNSSLEPDWRFLILINQFVIVWSFTMRIIDADGHVLEKQIPWADLLEAPYRSRAPKEVKDNRGFSFIMI